MLSVMMLSIYFICYYVQCHHAECYYVEYHCAECQYAEYHYAERHYAECCGWLLEWFRIILCLYEINIPDSGLIDTCSTTFYCGVTNGRAPKSCFDPSFQL